MSSFILFELASFEATLFDECANSLVADIMGHHYVAGAKFVELCRIVDVVGVADNNGMWVKLADSGNDEFVGVVVADGRNDKFGFFYASFFEKL